MGRALPQLRDTPYGLSSPDNALGFQNRETLGGALVLNEIQNAEWCTAQWTITVTDVLGSLGRLRERVSRRVACALRRFRASAERSPSPEWRNRWSRPLRLSSVAWSRMTHTL